MEILVRVKRRELMDRRGFEDNYYLWKFMGLGVIYGF